MSAVVLSSHPISLPPMVPSPSPRSSLTYWQVDVFSPKPFGGNSLTVFPEADGLTSAQMRDLTREMRHFESIFLLPSPDAERMRARVFDLTGELDFAGHPVLGAACVLHARDSASVDAPRTRRWTVELNARTVVVDTEQLDAVRFDAASADGASAPRTRTYRAVLDQGRPTFLGVVPDGRASEFAEAFGVAPDDLHPALPLEIVSTGLRYLVVPIVRGLAGARITRPDFEALLATVGAEFAYLLDLSEPTRPEGRHWNNDGVMEDVATGSGAGCVSAFLARHDVVPVGRDVVLRQGRFTGRPSEIRIRAEGRPDDITRILVGGDVSVVGCGTIEALPRDGSPEARTGRIPVYDASAIRAALTVSDLVEPMVDAFVAYSRGESETPVAVLHPSALGPAAGDAHVKSATLRGRPVFTVKVATWFATTAAARVASGEPTGGGLVAVFDAETGDALAVLHDEHALSDLRTAAAGAVVARVLVPDTAQVGGVIGTGVQAELQLLALASVRHIEVVHVWGRDEHRAAAFVNRLGARLPGVAVRAATSPRAVVDAADVIITATASREPLVEGAWLRPGQHVTAVGADDATKCELDATTLRRADRLVVDSRELTLRYGDVHRAVTRAELTADVVRSTAAELGEVLDGRAPGRRSAEEITVAKLIGLGVQDLIAAEVALARLGVRGTHQDRGASERAVP